MMYLHFEFVSGIVGALMGTLVLDNTINRIYNVFKVKGFTRLTCPHSNALSRFHVDLVQCIWMVHYSILKYIQYTPVISTLYLTLKTNLKLVGIVNGKYSFVCALVFWDKTQLLREYKHRKVLSGCTLGNT